MSKQFFYTRTEISQPKEGETELKTEKWIDSFNMDMVIRTAEYPGELVILLNDGHEVAEEFNMPNKNGKPEMVRKRRWQQSQIVIKGEDIINYRREYGEYGVTT